MQGNFRHQRRGSHGIGADEALASCRFSSAGGGTDDGLSRDDGEDSGFPSLARAGGEMYDGWADTEGRLGLAPSPEPLATAKFSAINAPFRGSSGQD